MTTAQEAARIRAISIARRRAEGRLAALRPEVLAAANQLTSIAEGISVECLQPKVLEGKLRRVVNALRATVAE
jgi:hypothetical protein